MDTISLLFNAILPAVITYILAGAGCLALTYFIDPTAVRRIHLISACICGLWGISQIITVLI